MMAFFMEAIFLRIGVLCLHGFTGAPYEVQPLVDFLQRRYKEWRIITPTLPGHGKELHLQGIVAEQWLEVTMQSYQKLQAQVDKVYVIGFSMGGLLAMNVALNFPVKKLVLLSAARHYIEPRQLLPDIYGVLKNRLTDNANQNFATLYARYAFKIGQVPLSACYQFIRLVEMTKPYITTITTPTFIVQGMKDGMVPYATARKLYDAVATNDKHLYLSKSGKHHICFSEDNYQWFEKVATFLQRAKESDY